jgi:cyclic-di-GMP-binding protein
LSRRGARSNIGRENDWSEATMAQQNSFDVSTGADLQEVDNAVNQAMKEVTTRYDFKNTKCSVNFDRAKSILTLDADDDYKLKALYDVLQTKFVKRGVPLKNMKAGTVQQASGGRVRQEVTLTQGIPTETAKEIVKAIKGKGFKKVQSAIQGDEVRISSPSKDELQEVMTFLRSQDFGVELKFGNYR